MKNLTQEQQKLIKSVFLIQAILFTFAGASVLFVPQVGDFFGFDDGYKKLIGFMLIGIGFVDIAIAKIVFKGADKTL